MTLKIAPAVKGLITAALMLVLSLAFYFKWFPINTGLEYIAYALYAAGIVWTLIDYRKSAAYTGKFGDLFGQGFRCFIVVTLAMTVFTWIFFQMHPEFAEENAKAYKEFLLKEKGKTPAEIDQEVTKYKDQFVTRFISASIFGYLIIGALVTAVASAFLTRRTQ